jgi:hypothetical protein
MRRERTLDNLERLQVLLSVNFPRRASGYGCVYQALASCPVIESLSADKQQEATAMCFDYAPCLSRLFSFHSRTTTLWVNGDARDE